MRLSPKKQGHSSAAQKNSFIQEFVPNYTLDAILAPRFTRDPQNIVVRPPTFNIFFVTYFHQFRIYESTIFFTKNILFSFLKELQSVFFVKIRICELDYEQFMLLAKILTLNTQYMTNSTLVSPVKILAFLA